LLQAVKNFDQAVDQAFEPLRGRQKIDWLAYVASEGADFSKAWHVAGIALALVKPEQRRHSLRLAVMLGIESIVVNGGLKRLTSRERPPLPEDRAYEVRRPNTKSFPSGHASSATLAAILLSEAVPKLRPLWLASAFVVAASRVHNRMHHGSDVAAGTVVGAAFAVAAKRFWPLGA